MPAENTPTTVLKPTARSAVTNGTRSFLTRGGELSVVGRRWRDIYSQIVEDRGGADMLSEGERQLARRCATLAIEAEIMEDTRAAGGELDLEGYIALTNAIGRALGRLGLRRAPRNITPRLSDIIEGRVDG